MASSIRTLPSALVVLSLLCVPLLQCNHENCDRLREDLLEEKNSWNECTRHEECILVGGNSQDCTGVMACNFAVHREHRLAAERRVLQLPEDTVDCLVCASPNCESGDIPFCEPVSGRCMIVTEIIEGDDEEATTGTAMQSVVSSDERSEDPAGEGGQPSFGAGLVNGEAGASP